MQQERAAIACTFQEKQNRFQSADYLFIHRMRRMNDIIFIFCGKAPNHIYLCPIIWINLADWLTRKVPPMKSPTPEKSLSLLFIYQSKAILVRASSETKSRENLMANVSKNTMQRKDLLDNVLWFQFLKQILSNFPINFFSIKSKHYCWLAIIYLHIQKSTKMLRHVDRRVHTTLPFHLIKATKSNNKSSIFWWMAM